MTLGSQQGHSASWDDIPQLKHSKSLCQIFYVMDVEWTVSLVIADGHFDIA